MSAPDKHGRPHHRWDSVGRGPWRCGDCPAELQPGTPVLYRTSPDGPWTRERPSCTRIAARSPWPKPDRARNGTVRTTECIADALADVRNINRARRTGSPT